MNVRRTEPHTNPEFNNTSFDMVDAEELADLAGTIVEEGDDLSKWVVETPEGVVPLANYLPKQEA